MWLTKAGPSYTLDSGHPHLLAIPSTPVPAPPSPASAERTTATTRPAAAPAPAQAPAQAQARSISQNQRGEVLTATVAASLGIGGGKPGQGYPAVMISTPSTPGAPASTGRPADPTGVVVAGTLTGRCGKGTNSTADDGAIVIDIDLRDQHTMAPTTAPATPPPAAPAAPPTTAGPASEGPPHSHDQPDGHQDGHQDGRLLVTVRRLTPRECERLQGFPDDWTALDASGRPVADAARYRAMGNAVAVPVVAWIGRRLLTATHATDADTDADAEKAIARGEPASLAMHEDVLVFAKRASKGAAGQ